MTPKPVSFRQIEPPTARTPEERHSVRIVDTFGFEIIEQTSPVPPANTDEARASVSGYADVVPFAATLRRIA